MSVHRYRWDGLFLDRLKKKLPPSAGVTIAGIGPRPIIDMGLVDDGSKPDLDAVMTSLGYSFASSSPVTPNGYLIVKQSLFTQLTVDTSTTSTAFGTVLSQGITTDAGFIDIQFTAAVTTLLAGAYFQIQVDGATVPGGGTSNLVIGTVCLARRVRVAVSAGAHVVTLRWRTSALGTVNCRPAGQPDQEHCSLSVVEADQ